MLLKTRLLAISLLCSSFTSVLVAKSSDSSDSSNSSNECVSAIHHAEQEADKCCKKITYELNQIKQQIEELREHQSPCCTSFAIDSVPVLINVPGKYCVTEDLIYDGNQSAIHITADNVTLNFANHSLTLTQDGSTGVFAENLRELTIENDAISTPNISTNPSSNAILLVNTDKVRLDNIFAENTYFGVRIQNSTDVFIKHCRFKNHIGGVPSIGSAGVRVEAGNAVVIEDSVFSGFNNDTNDLNIVFRTQSKDCRVSNCQFVDTGYSIFARDISGLIVENCEFNADPTAQEAFIVVGISPTEQGNNIVIRDSTFSNLQANYGFDGIYFYSGYGALVDNIIINANLKPFQTYQPAAIHVGCVLGNGGCDPELTYSDLVVRNSSVVNETQVNVYVESGHDVVLDNCFFCDALSSNIFTVHSKGTVIKNCVIRNGGNEGIHIADISSDTAVRNCLIYGNQGTGILIDTLSTNTHLSDNRVYDNGRDGINNISSTNLEAFFNTSCHNGGTDCVMVPQAQYPGESPSIAGSNVCCDYPIPPPQR